MHGRAWRCALNYWHTLRWPSLLFYFWCFCLAPKSWPPVTELQLSHNVKKVWIIAPFSAGWFKSGASNRVNHRHAKDGSNKNAAKGYLSSEDDAMLHFMIACKMQVKRFFILTTRQLTLKKKKNHEDIFRRRMRPVPKGEKLPHWCRNNKMKWKKKK